MNNRIIFVSIFVFFTFLSITAQNNYSACYTNNISKGNTAFSQGKYSEARTYYVNAKQCAGGNPTEAQNKINSCDAKIRAQAKAEEDRRKAAEAAAEAKRKAEAEAAETKRRAEQEAVAAKKRAEEAAERERKAEEERKKTEKRKAEETNCEFLTDVDGNRYRLVQLGSQCWMAENLRVTRYADGSKVESFYYPNNEYNRIKDYGYLYGRIAVLHCQHCSKDEMSKKIGTQGICPDGWHVPTENDWKDLFDYLSNQSQYTCADDKRKIVKSLASSTGWREHGALCSIGDDLSANNATGYNLMPAGMYQKSWNYDGASDFQEMAYLWSSSVSQDKKISNESIPLVYEFRYESALIYRSDGGYTHAYGRHAFSVRCIRD